MDRLEMSIVTNPTPSWGQQTIVAKAANQSYYSIRFVFVAFNPRFASNKAGLVSRHFQEVFKSLDSLN